MLTKENNVKVLKLKRINANQLERLHRLGFCVMLVSETAKPKLKVVR